MIEYKYDEDRYLEELTDYVDATYSEHYSRTSFKQQSLLLTVDMEKGSVSETS